MTAETPDEAMQRASTHLLDQILEPGCTLSPPHDLLPNRCVKVDDQWVVFRRLDEDGRMVVTKAGSCAEWTYTPEPHELVMTAEPF